MGIPNLFEEPFQTEPDCARLSDQRLGRARRLIANKQVQNFPILSAGQRNTIARQKARKKQTKGPAIERLELCSCEEDLPVVGMTDEERHAAQQEFMSADEERVKAADAARVAAEEKLRAIEQQSTKSSETSVAEREEWQKARDQEIASDPGPHDGIPAQFRAVAPVKR